MHEGTKIKAVEIAKTNEESLGLIISNQQVRVMRKSTVDISENKEIQGDAVINSIKAGVVLDIVDGNLTVQGNIQDGVSIHIKNGNITVEGCVGDNVNLRVFCGRIKVIKNIGENLRVSQKIRTITKNTYYYCCFSTTYKTIRTFGNTSIFGIQFFGNIGNNCKIATDNTVYCRGNIGSQCYIKARDEVKINELGAGSFVTSIYGPISMSNMKRNSTVTTTCNGKEKGKIRVEKVETECLLKSKSGSIDIKSLGERSRIESNGGEIRVGVVNSYAQVKSVYGMMQATAIDKSAEVCSEIGKINVKVSHKKAKVESQIGLVDIGSFFGQIDSSLSSESLFREDKPVSLEKYKQANTSILLKDKTYPSNQ